MEWVRRGRLQLSRSLEEAKGRKLLDKRSVCFQEGLFFVKLIHLYFPVTSPNSGTLRHHLNCSTLICVSWRPVPPVNHSATRITLTVYVLSLFRMRITAIAVCLLCCQGTAREYCCLRALTSWIPVYWILYYIATLLLYFGNSYYRKKKQS